MTESRPIGGRIKRVRQDKRLTLKAVEAASGVSATHVSEIERGETSPTIGALWKIARALGKRPAFFLEEAELGEVSVVTAENRVRESRGGGAATVERLTTSVPGGRVQACRITLSPGRSHRSERHAHEGAEAIIVLEGSVRVEVGEESQELTGGDVAHFDASLPHAFMNGSKHEPAVLLWVATRRDVA